MSMEMHSSVQNLFRPTYKPFYISFSAFFSASFVEMFVTNRVQKSQLESYVTQLESDMVRHRE